MPLLETKGAASAQGFGLTLGGEEAVYVEDVFSTYLYTGNGSTQTITNGIDLSGEGGLVWLKLRSGPNAVSNHALFDTSRGAGNRLATNTTDANFAGGNLLTAFTNSGFVLDGSVYNDSSNAPVSWTFRKQPKFFDVVTYTGTGANRTVAHDLGSIPGCIIVKRTDTTGDWQVYHRANTANPETDYLVLNSTAATADSNTRWNDTLPTATEFSLGTEATVNASGGTYVAYLFAHNAGGFGLTGTDNVISCGSYTGNGSATGPEINLGWEPQYILIKDASATNSWYVMDQMRNIFNDWLVPNTSAAEVAAGNPLDPTATGFQIKSASGLINTTGNTYIYIAIRRGPMKVPTTGTEVYNAIAITETQSDNRNISGVGFAPDTLISPKRAGTYVSGYDRVYDRLRGPLQYLRTTASSAETSSAASEGTLTQDGVIASSSGSAALNDWSGDTRILWFFRRAPGFFDVVCYTGTGSVRTVSHNLGAVPELMIVKKRSAADAWVVYANNDNTDYLVLNTTAATVDDNTIWNDTSPTSSVFTVGTNDDVNGNTATFVAYLFATVAGVSKVDSYTGSGTTKQIDCGFTAGARFVLIKRTDSTGSWYCWDSARGIVAGNDPYLLLNSTDAEVTSTDYIDTYSAGFEITSTAPAAINASGGTFIFLAIA